MWANKFPIINSIYSTGVSESTTVVGGVWFGLEMKEGWPRTDGLKPGNRHTGV